MFEIEKKLVYNEENKEGIDKLISSAVFIKEVVNDDVYYDTENSDLLVKEIYLRTRNGLFELKVSQSEKKKSIRGIEQHIEIENEDEIRKYLNMKNNTEEVEIPPHCLIKKNGELKDDLEKAGYVPKFSYKVTRKKYKSGKFVIDFDEADYGFTTVEIELLVEKEEEMAGAMKKIIDFAKSYGLEKSPERGKLFEYIYRFNKKAYKRVVDAGIV